MTEPSTEPLALAPKPPTLAVVIPFRGRSDLLDRCLDSVAGLSPAPDEVVVVGDGERARDLRGVERRGFRLLATPECRGAAAARNLGAAASRAELLLFVDADVVLPPDTVARVREVLGRRPELDAVFGSYDDLPPGSGAVSRFKNLLHHWTHQRARSEATTFWTGCGAIRRRVFESLGGFDPDQRWLEDVELGYRLRAAGHRVFLDRSLQVTHLKQWSLATMAVSDVCHRAWPWSELARRYRSLPPDLNGDLRGRASVALAATAVSALVAAPLASPRLAALAAAAVVALLVLNRGLYRLLFRSGGPALLAIGIGLHWLHLLWGGGAYAAGSLWWRLAGVRRRGLEGTVVDPVPAPEATRTIAQDVASEPGSGSIPSARRRSA
ncbi:MAG TPA: glycosyltransferase family A protein [Candidatus Sulfomarinibacteraceae bacterium]|nr:glycosyltransferase family A protein [Candidatus Sulfomarinibacteraceae bacterium]